MKEEELVREKERERRRFIKVMVRVTYNDGVKGC